MILIKSGPCGDPVYAYALSELQRLLNRITSEETATAASSSTSCSTVFHVFTDASLEKGQICLRTAAGSVEISGNAPVDVLHAVYTFFEQLGCIFEISGELLPAKVQTLSLPVIGMKHVPSLRQRGIRMHLNFVQDQSFFTEKEFEAYIDNIARQKYNYLIFHMYTPNQWFPFSYRGEKHLDHVLGTLGRKPLKEGMIGREKVKVKNHWFPAEFEEITDSEELLKAVYGRFKRMMARCSARGIDTCVSLEPESIPAGLEGKLDQWSRDAITGLQGGGNFSVELQQNWSGQKSLDADIRNGIILDIAVERCLQCIDAFPHLNELQLISREAVQWRAGSTEEYRRELERISAKFNLPADLFSKSLLEQKTEINDGPEMHRHILPTWAVPPGDDYYPALLGCLRFVEFALEILADGRLAGKLKERGLKSSIAVYMPHSEVLKHMMPAVARMMPKGIRFGCLGDYGAKGIAGAMDAWEPLREYNQEIQVISWFEFDGTMMLAQSWMDAIAQNIRKASALGAENICFNHWRVRSQEQNSAIASRLCWDAGLSAREAKEDYLRKLYGEKNLEAALEAYGRLEAATVYARDKTFNIGFVGDYLFFNCTSAPGYYWAYILQALQKYRSACRSFSLLKEKSEDHGLLQAEYLEDLCRISCLHIEAVQHLQNAKLPLSGHNAWPLSNRHAVWPHPQKLSELLSEGTKALELEYDYMKIYSKRVRSCDEQGQLVMQQQGFIDNLEAFLAELRRQYDEQSLLLQSLEPPAEQKG